MATNTAAQFQEIVRIVSQLIPATMTSIDEAHFETVARCIKHLSTGVGREPWMRLNARSNRHRFHISTTPLERFALRPNGESESRGPESLKNCGVSATLSAIGQKYRRENEIRCQQNYRTCAYFFRDRNDSI
jgi:hypothetical protein